MVSDVILISTRRPSSAMRFHYLDMYLVCLTFTACDFFCSKQCSNQRFGCGLHWAELEILYMQVRSRIDVYESMYMFSVGVRHIYMERE